MTFIQLKYNNYDFNTIAINDVKAYIQTHIYPISVRTNYQKKLYDNKWKVFQKDNTLFYEPAKLVVIKNDGKEKL